MYFNGCATKDELKAVYKKLAIKYHPDMGGDNETMAKINAEYDEALKWVKNTHKKEAPTSNAGKDGSESAENLDDGFREVLIAVFNIADVEVELCGSWLWISGATKEHRAELKAAGLRWAPKKKKWYWHPADEFPRHGHKPMSMDYIRTKYGSTSIEREKDKKRVTA